MEELLDFAGKNVHFLEGNFENDDDDDSQGSKRHTLNVAALILEEQEQPLTFVLRFDNDTYHCGQTVHHLKRSINDALRDRQYLPPDRMFVFKTSPFVAEDGEAVVEVKENDIWAEYTTTPANIRTLALPADHRVTANNLFIILVSPLKEIPQQAQLAMNLSLAAGALHQATQREQSQIATMPEIVSSFVNWLDSKFPPAYGLPREVSRPFIPQSFGEQLPFEGRSSVIADCEALLTSRFTNRNIPNRKSHPIGVVGGASGVGKTRTLKELIRAVHKFAAAKHIPWVAPVLITYNDGQLPDTDRDLNKPMLAFALRILYFAFRHDLQGLSFAEFVREVPLEIRNNLSPEFAIRIIQRVMNTTHGGRASKEPQGIVYLAVDETNKLLNNEFSVIDKQYRQFLGATMVALTGTMFLQDVFVFTVVADTTMAPLEAVFHDSTAEYKFLRMHLLGWDDLSRIMDNLEEDDARCWHGWYNDAEFMSLLIDFGPLPGLAAKLLEYCIDALQYHAWGRLPHNEIRRKLMREVIIPEDETGNLAYQLIEDAVLAVEIKRTLHVVENSPWTYQRLESDGLLVLGSSDEGLRVELIRPRFDYLLSIAARRSPEAAALQRAIQCLPAGVTITEFTWQKFEEFTAHYEAAKEMFWYRRRTRLGEQPVCTLSEFYGANANHSPSWENLQVQLSAVVHVHKCTKRFPEYLDIRDEDRQPVSGLDTAVMFRNAEGARIDTFRSRETQDGGIIFMMGQQILKRFNSTVLSLEQVLVEVGKAETAAADMKAVLLQEEQAKFRHQLVIFATRAEEILFQRLHPSIPENCILLGGPALREYFGTVLSDRTFVALSGVPVKINFASPQSLLAVPGLGEMTVDRIMAARHNEGPFNDWDNLKARVPVVRDTVEKYLSFGLEV